MNEKVSHRITSIANQSICRVKQCLGPRHRGVIMLVLGPTAKTYSKVRDREYKAIVMFFASTLPARSRNPWWLLTETFR